MDSVLPLLQFATLVALFAGIGTWYQVVQSRNHAVGVPIDNSNSTAQQSATPARKTVDRPIRTPTAIGPVGTKPESGTRVGRVQSSDDFARLRGDIMPYPSETANADLAAPALVGPGLPRLQITELPTDAAEASNDVTRATDSIPSGDATQPTRPSRVASVPGFHLETPSR
ncbi:MAG TPA: hypothetical protein VHU84_02140 [Lacipirellulaceae bacterium]|nr:hypothetical protein [Lacipirellulaceae bacterium]